MEFSKDEAAYLAGEPGAFSTGLRIRVARPEARIRYRMETIEDLVRGRDVIHLGCADHVSSIDGKIEANKWFHKRLAEKASRCLGVDIDPEGVARMRELGYTDVVCADLAADGLPKEASGARWDALVLGEILEHQDDPVSFLKGLVRACRGSVDRMIVSAPNALRHRNFSMALRQSEAINSDHRYWFTPYTLAKVGARAGLEIRSFQCCQSFRVPPHGLAEHAILRLFPALRDDVVAVFHIP